MRRYEFIIAKRYLTAKRKQAFISVITFISVLGIAIGVMALIIAIALITGFQEDVQDKILGATSHIMVQGFSHEGIKDYEIITSKIEEYEDIESVSPVVYDTVLVKGSYRSSGAMLKGVDFDLEKKHAQWLRKLESGTLPETQEREKAGIVIGRELASSIGARVGDSVVIISSSSRLSPIGLFPKTQRFKVSGLFSSGLYEFDSSTALISISAAQELFGYKESVNLIQIRIDDIFKAQQVARRIQGIVSPSAFVTTWMEMNKSLFSALKLEKNIMFLTISLIVFVAALNIIATLILMVMEKTKDIGILIAMGATPDSIEQIFFHQGALIGVIGTAFGVFLGLLWCFLANTFQLIKVPVDIYQIAYVPFHIKPLDLIIIIVITLLITSLSTLFPALRASRVDPVTALKYE